PCQAGNSCSGWAAATLPSHSPWRGEPVGDGYLVHQVNVLDRIQQRHAVFERSLEGLAPGDQAHPAGPLVDDGGLNRLLEIVVPHRGAARVDQAAAAQVAVDDLVAGEVDRMVGGQLVVDLGGGLAEFQDLKAPVGLRQFLLDDVGLDADSQVVRLAGQVGGKVVVDAILHKRRIAE